MDLTSRMGYSLSSFTQIPRYLKGWKKENKSGVRYVIADCRTPYNPYALCVLFNRDSLTFRLGEEHPLLPTPGVSMSPLVLLFTLVCHVFSQSPDHFLFLFTVWFNDLNLCLIFIKIAWPAQILSRNAQVKQKSSTPVGHRRESDSTCKDWKKNIAWSISNLQQPTELLLIRFSFLHLSVLTWDTVVCGNPRSLASSEILTPACLATENHDTVKVTVFFSCILLLPHNCHVIIT